MTDSLTRPRPGWQPPGAAGRVRCALDRGGAALRRPGRRRGRSDWYAGGVAASASGSPGRWSRTAWAAANSAPAPATRRRVRAYEELIEAEYLAAEQLVVRRPDPSSCSARVVRGHPGDAAVGVARIGSPAAGIAAREPPQRVTGSALGSNAAASSAVAVRRRPGRRRASGRVARRASWSARRRSAVAGGDLGEGPSRAGDRAGDLVGRRHAHDVLLGLPRLGGRDLAQVGGRRVDAVGRGAVRPVRSRACVGGWSSDFAVLLLVGTAARWAASHSSAVTTGSGSASPAWRSASQGLGALGGGAGAGGVGEPGGARVVELLELAGTPVEGVGQGRGLGGLPVQPDALGAVGGGAGFGAAQGRGLAVVGGGLVGAGKFLGRRSGAPRPARAASRGRACGAGRRTAPGGLVDLRAAQRTPRGPVGRVLPRPDRPSGRHRGRRPGRRGRAAPCRPRRYPRAPPTPTVAARVTGHGPRASTAHAGAADAAARPSSAARRRRRRRARRGSRSTPGCRCAGPTRRTWRRRGRTGGCRRR